jgi:peroxiredoxin
MAEKLSPGSEAPNFDLTSTEDVVLMLRDEVARTPVVLYLFAASGDERVQRDLAALGRWSDKLKERRTVVLAVSPEKPEALKKVQKSLQLPFPLLSDDRNFLDAYGVVAAAEEKQPEPALFLVNRDQRLLWLANPVASVEESLPEVDKTLQSLPSPTANYPKSVVNRVVDWWINKIRRPRLA